MTYEGMVEEAFNSGIDICETTFIGGGKGYHIDDTIFINNKLNNIEKKCILAEELGHVHNTTGTILNQRDIKNRKQEIVARRWGYKKLVGIIDLINAYKASCLSKSDIAEYLDITEEFLNESIEYYRQKYGLYYEIDNYLIYFEPNLAIVERF